MKLLHFCPVRHIFPNMSKEVKSIEANYFVLSTPDGKLHLIGDEVYFGEEELKNAIEYNDNINRDRILYGMPSFVLSIAGVVDGIQRVIPFIQSAEKFKLDTNLVGGTIELAISAALLAYAANSLSQIRSKAMEIEKVKFALENPEYIEIEN